MRKVDITYTDILYPDKRDLYQNINNFLSKRRSDPNYHDKILILYGLPKTGKRTLIQQTINDAPDKDKFAFYIIDENDTIYDIENTIEKEQKNNTKHIIFDEITKIPDFAEDAGSLVNVYATEGMDIILSGTDSLGFNLAKNKDLFGKCIILHTTHIPFAEHARVLSLTDIDDYIKHGGLMSQNTTDAINSIQDNTEYTKKIAQNIANSLRKNSNNNPLKVLTTNELTTIINKIVEKYSGVIDEQLITQDLKKSSVTYINDKIKNVSDDRSYIKYMNKESTKKNIAKDFLPLINADTEIKTSVDENMVYTLISTLEDMDVLSTIKNHTFKEDEDKNWSGPFVSNDYYIIQPAIKYHHLLKSQDFIKQSEWYNKLDHTAKNYLTNKLEENIFGDMLEQIILFDVKKDLHDQTYTKPSGVDKDRYTICKPEFIPMIPDEKQGEYDMLIADNKTNTYYVFEIKHTDKPVYEQAKHLLNPEFDKITQNNYGHCKDKIILYRGDNLASQDNIKYLNINDFLTTIHNTRDIHKTIETLTKSIPMQKILTSQEHKFLDDLHAPNINTDEPTLDYE